MKKALISGASGLLGSLVGQTLTEDGYKVTAIKHKKPTKAAHELSFLYEFSNLQGQHFDLVINLAGAPIAAKPWSEARKQVLRNSRVTFTEDLINTLVKNQITVGHFVSGSAIGYYGVTESSVDEHDPHGHDFSAQLCVDWEKAAQSANQVAEHVSFIRTGLVLSNRGGYLTPLKLTSQLGLGAVFGSGEQGQSWIHEQDWLGGLRHLIQHPTNGPINLTAPTPISQKTLIDKLSKQLKRPRWLSVPSPLFIPTGEMKTLFIEGQFVVPKRLVESGYEFKHPNIEGALSALL